MKKRLSLFLLGLAGILVGIINSCKKDVSSNHSKSFTEEFDNYSSVISKGWITQDNSPYSGVSAQWRQGINSYDKAGTWIGFPAYSYKKYDNEFIYSLVDIVYGSYSLSNWLISPVLSVQNGDKISFYTRADTGSYRSRMQVLMDNSSSESVGASIESVGDFTTILFDVNSAQVIGGYPTVWTKYEYTFSGLTGRVNTRIAFRHYLNNVTDAKGIGIDQFKFQAR